MANEYVNDNHEIMGIDKVTQETRRIRTNADGELIISSADLSAILSTLQGTLNTTLTGSKVCLSTEEKPVGVQGDTLLEYNTETKETKVYKYISGDWREL